MPMKSNVTAEARDITETAFEGLAVGAVAIVAVLANVSLFAVVLTSRQLRNESNVLILSLSLADLLVSAVSMPLTTATIIFGTWTFNLTTCVTVGFLNMLTFTASVQSLVVISVNRYFKICRPSRFADIYTYQNVLGMCLGVWLVSGLVSMPPLLGWAAYSYLPNSYICFCEWRRSTSYAFFMISFCFCLPCSAMTFCNIGILKAYVNSKKAVDSFAEKPQTSRPDQAAVKRFYQGSKIVSDLEKNPKLKPCKTCQCLCLPKVKVFRDEKMSINDGYVNNLSSSTNINCNAEFKKTDIFCNYQCLNNSKLSPDCLLFVHPSTVTFDTLQNSGGSMHVEPTLAQAETYRDNEGDRIIDAEFKPEAGPSQRTQGNWNQTDFKYGTDHDQTDHYTVPEAPSCLMQKPKGSVVNRPLIHNYSTTNSVIVIRSAIASDNQLHKAQHLHESGKDMHAGSSKVKTSFQKPQITKRRTRQGIDFHRIRKRRASRLESLLKSVSARSNDCKGERIRLTVTSHRDQVTSVDQKSVTWTFKDCLNIKEPECTYKLSSGGFDYLFNNSFTQKVRKRRRIRSIRRGVLSSVNNCLKSLKDDSRNEIFCQLFKTSKSSSNTNFYQRSKSLVRGWNKNRITPIPTKEIDSILKHGNTAEHLDDGVCCCNTRLESIQEINDYKNVSIVFKEKKRGITSLSSFNRTSGSVVQSENVTKGSIFLRSLVKENKINQECSTELNISSLVQNSLVDHTSSLLSQPQTNVIKMAEEATPSHLWSPFSIDTRKCLLSVPSMEKNMQESSPEKREPLTTKSSLKSTSKSERRKMEEFHLAASLLVVILLFVVCWFPYCVSMFVVIFSPEHSSKGLDLASLCLGYFNSCLNPIVYGVMNKKFKMAYRRMLLSLIRPFRFQKNLNFAARFSKRSRVEPLTIASVTST